MSISVYLKKIIKRLLLILIVFAIIFFLINIYIQYRLENKSEQTYYKEFGIAIPTKYKIHGIDVSKYQSYIYWKSVKNMEIDSIKIEFALIKATEGVNDIDKMFERNWASSKLNKITRGAYHFFIATKDGKIQAKNFISNVKLETGDLPPVVDIENDFKIDKKIFKQRVLNCLNEIENHYKVKPIIYSNVDFYNNYLGKDFDKYQLWVAHFTEDKKPDISRDWIFWQHSEKGNVNGITEKLDFNVFIGDSIQFLNLLIK